VVHRRDDALTAVWRDRLENLLAESYQDVGYHLEHVETGATAGRFARPAVMTAGRNSTQAGEKVRLAAQKQSYF